MATFEYTAPDGSVYHFDGNEADAHAAFSSLGGKQAPDTLTDVAKSAAAGAQSGFFSGAFGGPAVTAAQDLYNLATGAPRSKEEMPTGALTEAYQQATHPAYQSQTYPGRIVRSAAEAAANPVSYAGPGGVIGNAITSAGAGAGGEMAAENEFLNSYLPEPVSRFLGGLVGGTAAAGLPRAVTPFPATQPYRTQQAQLLQANGIVPTAGDVTGSKGLKRLERVLPSIPFGGGNEFTEQPIEQLTHTVLGTAGVMAPRGTQPVMNQAFTNIGHEYDNLGQAYNPTITPQHVTDLHNTAANYALDVAPTNQVGRIPALANDIQQMAAQNGGRLTGQQYNTLRTQIGELARNQGDPTAQRALYDMNDTLNGAMRNEIQQGGNAAHLQAFDTLNGRYRNLLVAERALALGGEAGAQGLITPQALANATRAVYGTRNLVRGNGALPEIAQAARGVMTPASSSGTAENQNIMRWLGAEGPLIGAIAGGEGTADKAMTTLAGAATGFLPAAAISRGYQLPFIQNWLKNQRLPWRMQTSPGAQALIQALMQPQ